MNSQRILAVFDAAPQARQVVSRLRQSGVADEAISTLAADSVTARALLDEERHHAADGALNGAAVGAGAAAVAATAGLGLIATGPLAVVFAGVAAGGVAGGLLGALIGLGIPQSASELYVSRFERGAVMVAVDCDSEAASERAREILGAHSPVQVAVVHDPAVHVAVDSEPGR